MVLGSIGSSTHFFYKLLGCLALSLRFGQKISNSLATAQPEMGNFLTFSIEMTLFSFKKVCLANKTKQFLGNFQPRSSKIRNQLQAQIENRVAYKKICRYQQIRRVTITLN